MHYIVVGRCLELSERRTHVHLDLLGRAHAYYHIVGAAHVVLDILGEVIAGNLYALVADDAAQRYHGDFGGAAAYIHYHIAFGRLYVETDTQGSRHRLINHIHIAAISVL